MSLISQVSDLGPSWPFCFSTYVTVMLLMLCYVTAICFYLSGNFTLQFSTGD
jgi:hypothetical protein